MMTHQTVNPPPDLTISFTVVFLPFDSMQHQPLELLLGFWTFQARQEVKVVKNYNV